MPRLAQVTPLPDERVPIARIEGEIDISNAADVRDALEQLVGNAALGLVVDLSDVRYWARDQGIKVSDRGRIPADVLARYRAAH